MNAVMNQVIAWLAGFEGVAGAQRVTPDLLEDGDHEPERPARRTA